MSNLQEKLDTKQLATSAGERIRESFKALARMVRDVEVKKIVPGPRQFDVLERFSQELVQGMVICDIYGRMRTMHELEVKQGEIEARRAGLVNLKVLAEHNYKAIFTNEDNNQKLVEWINLPFEEAAAHIAEREPMLAQGWMEAAEAYNRQGFALARNTSIELARELQRRMSTAIIEGRNPLDEAKDDMWLSKDFDRQYMNVVATTNFAGAYVAGREKQMRSPGVAKHIVAHIFKSALLPTTRPNHRACHDFIADPDDPLWEYLSPLLGYSCYCRKRPIFEAEMKNYGLELESNGHILPAKRPPGAEPDNSYFGHRPDKKVYTL